MSKRILVVDDDIVFVKLLQRFLSEDYEVSTALSGVQATHMIKTSEPDLLLLDIEMPGKDGFATLDYIKNLQLERKLHVIFITGRTDRDTLKRCAAAGASGYIEKPIVKDNLLRQVASILQA